MKLLRWIGYSILFIIGLYYGSVALGYMLNPLFPATCTIDRDFREVQQKMEEMGKEPQHEFMRGLVGNQTKWFKVLEATPEKSLQVEFETVYNIGYGWETVGITISSEGTAKTNLVVDYSEFGFYPFFPPFAGYNPGFIRERQLRNRLKEILSKRT